MTTTVNEAGHSVAVLVVHPDGSGTVDISFASVPLLPGPHVIHAEATGFGRQHLYEHVQNALRFDVMTGSTHESNGLVTFGPTWSGTGLRG